MNRVIISVILISCVCIYNSFSATIKVPEGYSSLQQALDSASESDTILVAPGIYMENLVWPSTQGIKLFSTAGADNTILEIEDTGSVCAINSGVDTSTIIRGFTFRKGDAGGM